MELHYKKNEHVLELNKILNGHSQSVTFIDPGMSTPNQTCKASHVDLLATLETRTLALIETHMPTTSNMKR